MLKNVLMAISGHKSQFLYLDFKIFKNLASLSLFNLKYALLAQLNYSLLIEVYFSYVFYHYGHLIMLRGKTFVWLM